MLYMLHINRFELLKPYKTEYETCRLGKNNDGGYVVIDLPNHEYNLLLSGGISNDVSFENDFNKKYPNTKINAYDASITKLPNDANDNIVFIKKYIGDVENDMYTTLKSAIIPGIFVKTDIESGEYPWFKIIDSDNINNFDQIVIELHAMDKEETYDIIEKYY
jgi:hypothetical protein